jgi:tuberous sclerosis 1
MSGLLSIISLLPIIPSSISTFLPDLFEIFNHLAAWTYQPQNVKDCELIHLQCGFHLLFNRLYGMYPCNFIEFLRNEYINKQDKTQIFNYSIRSFLDSVRIHPNLVMSTKTSETNISRFKKMEPHDVVVECTKYAIESDRPPPTSNFLEYHNKPLEYTHLTSDLPPPHAQLASAKSVDNTFESLWSPSYVVLATPPPSGTVPNTPTPTPVPMQPNYSMAISNNHQSHGTERSSPPQLIEAAIEATPESTPIKPELRNTFRPYQTSSQAARNIWPKSGGNNSTPSSPMKKDSQQFLYSSGDHSNASQQYSMDFSGNPKLFRMLSDRSAAELMQTSSEDQEVNDINSQNASGEGNGHQLAEMMDYDDEPETEDEDEDADTTPPLTQPTFYESVNYVRRVKRLRMYSHCLYSAGTSPADTTSYMPRAASIQRLKRYNSWPNLISSDVVIDSTKSKEANGQQHPSSSPSDEAISAVSHFKKNDQNGNATNENLYKKIRDDLKAKPFEKVQKVSKATSTLDRWPAMNAYDILFYDTMASDEIKRKKSEEVVASVVTTTTTTTSVSVSKSPAMEQPQQCLSPNELLEKYIQVSLKRNNATEHRDHIELLALMLQFEKSRREIHAERNRRLLGKSRQIRGLEQSNQTLTDQLARLSSEITNLNKKATEANNLHQLKLLKCQEETRLFSRKCNEESERNKQLQREKESLQLRLDEEILLKRQALQKNDNLLAEIFDLKNLLEAANEQAQRGEDYRKRLVKLEAEMIIFNDARVKCQQKMEELNSLKARDIDMKYLAETYCRDLQNAKQTVDLDRAELEVYRSRVYDLEQQTRHKEKAFAEQKRLIQSIQDTHEEKFRVSFKEENMRNRF